MEEETVAAVSKHPMHSRASVFLTFLGEEWEIWVPSGTLTPLL